MLSLLSFKPYILSQSNLQEILNIVIRKNFLCRKYDPDMFKMLMLYICIIYAKYRMYFLQYYAKSMAKFMFERVLNRPRSTI